MNTNFLKDKSQALHEAEQEYLKLGLQLKELSRGKIAEKFSIPRSSVTAVAQLDIDDFILIGELLIERRKMVERRAFLRRSYLG